LLLRALPLKTILWDVFIFDGVKGYLLKDRRVLILGEVASPRYLNELFASQLLVFAWTFALDVCRERMKARMLSHELYHIQTCHMNYASPGCCKSRPFRFAHISHKHLLHCMYQVIWGFAFAVSWSFRLDLSLLDSIQLESPQCVAVRRAKAGVACQIVSTQIILWLH